MFDNNDPNNPLDLFRIIIKAVENPEYDYRTKEGIMRETGLSLVQIDYILHEFDDIIAKATFSSVMGDPLFYSKRKKNIFRVYWDFFRSIV